MSRLSSLLFTPFGLTHALNCTRLNRPRTAKRTPAFDPAPPTGQRPGAAPRSSAVSYASSARMRQTDIRTPANDAGRRNILRRPRAGSASGEAGETGCPVDDGVCICAAVRAPIGCTLLGEAYALQRRCNAQRRARRPRTAPSDGRRRPATVCTLREDFATGLRCGRVALSAKEKDGLLGRAASRSSHWPSAS